MSDNKPIDCEQALAQIFQFIDHELRPEEHDAMEKHLHTCKSCFSRADFERRLKAKLNSLRDAAEPVAKNRIEKLLKSL